MMLLKTKIILISMHLSLLYSASPQGNVDMAKHTNVTDIKSQAESDWIGVDSIKTYFCNTPKELEHYHNSSFLEKRRFEDTVEKKRLQLAENFLEKYPNDAHYYDVLTYFLHYLFEPKFIADKIPDSTLWVLNQDSKLTKTHRDLFLSQMRALPIDEVARARWLKKGNELVEKFLESNAPLEQKAKIEMRLMGRDLRMALFQYEYMNFQKNTMESGYWERFDTYYWEPFRLRLKTLLFKYPDLETLALNVEQFIAIISREYLSPELTEPSWQYFYNITDATHPLGNQKGIKAVHTMAKENLKARNDLKDVDASQPLELVFTAMDGSRIDLKTMRGKVVLLDFWSVRCGPCIMEMPHVKALYDTYRDKGFEVIGIVANSDTEKAQVLKILKKQNANWPQRLDKGSEVTVSYHSLYNITSLPTVWLLDKEGKIVDRNARGMRLEPLIRKYLGLD
ncbi:TlpA disulfide reductase family protein [Mariniflexile litorale]|uniref:TlpA disulfide reductase family protein n=1 Tax=Mariniflexile litorale TaxID=3045158 RepID=A0AAU7EE51_9FLAO|nr:TlpA disulfide reductase family protein [Mariniflexile sp. KMM 9835]MDQ8213477.1 TlpA disulfide reductase family protein [Mariniflexile sp. KMM 9835]